jgi:hypothetical protein
VGRDERIEAILAARYELEQCAPSERAQRHAELNRLLDEAIAGTSVSRLALLEALHPYG